MRSLTLLLLLSLSLSTNSHEVIRFDATLLSVLKENNTHFDREIARLKHEIQSGNTETRIIGVENYSIHTHLKNVQTLKQEGSTSTKPVVGTIQFDEIGRPVRIHFQTEQHGINPITSTTEKGFRSPARTEFYSANLQTREMQRTEEKSRTDNQFIQRTERFSVPESIPFMGLLFEWMEVCNYATADTMESFSTAEGTLHEVELDSGALLRFTTRNEAIVPTYFQIACPETIHSFNALDGQLASERETRAHQVSQYTYEENFPNNWPTTIMSLTCDNQYVRTLIFNTVDIVEYRDDLFQLPEEVMQNTELSAVN